MWYFIDHPLITSLFSCIMRCANSAFAFSAPSPGIIPLSKDFWIFFIQKSIYKPKSRHQICSFVWRCCSSQAFSADRIRESIYVHTYTHSCAHTHILTSHFFFYNCLSILKTMSSHQYPQFQSNPAGLIPVFLSIPVTPLCNTENPVSCNP